MTRPKAPYLLPILMLLLAVPAAAFELPWQRRDQTVPQLPPRPVVSVVMTDLPSE